MNNPQDNELFQQVKDRFLKAAKEVVLLRLKDVQDRFPEVDPDLAVELVILTGIGFLNRLERSEGRGDATEFLDHLLQELTYVACQRDEGLLASIQEAAERITKKREQEAEEAQHKEVPISVPLPGVGLFGFKFPKEEN